MRTTLPSLLSPEMAGVTVMASPEADRVNLL